MSVYFSLDKCKKKKEGRFGEKKDAPYEDTNQRITSMYNFIWCIHSVYDIAAGLYLPV